MLSRVVLKRSNLHTSVEQCPRNKLVGSVYVVIWPIQMLSNSKVNTWNFNPIVTKHCHINKQGIDHKWYEQKCVETEGTAQWTSGKFVIDCRKEEGWVDWTKDEDQEYCIRIWINASRCEEVYFKDCQLLVYGGEFAEDSEDSEDEESDE
eukprot:Mrub_06988.p2 GENE.Mrub_06988~~Mrub_06988.p2  ORF type:complete len:150 (-),score=12.74 Mrub_06988:391-840(-)